MAKSVGERSTAALLKDWSITVRSRDGNKCVVCGAAKYVQAHHLLPKERYPELKYELLNGVSLCVKHHKFGKFSAHRNGFWFARKIQAMFPTVYQWIVDHMGEEPGL